MDPETVRYYDRNAWSVVHRYDAAHRGIDRHFPAAFSPGDRILDIGAGSGRDILRLCELGCDAVGVEPSEPLRNQAISDHPALHNRLFAGCLPELTGPGDEGFDGVLCSAVLMHLPERKMFDAAFAIRRVLKPHGRLLLSIPGSPDRGAAAPVPMHAGEHRDRHGRLYSPLVPGAVALLFERLGFQLIGQWSDPDSLGREGVRWTTLLFERRSASAIRPIDQIEGILNRDRKTTTYKLALFRALCDIARTSPRSAGWRPDGDVAIPIRSLAELWIGYYWPLVGSDSAFIPQTRGERPGCAKPLRFRLALTELAESYGDRGGLAAFLQDLRDSRVSGPDEKRVKVLTSQVATAIRQGPATYAGGALETGRMFWTESGDLIVPGAVWREICLAGHWIHDALILRWAELTSAISRGEIPASRVIDLLLADPLPDRDVAAARRVYDTRERIECVWSGRRPLRRFEVDHLLPYSIWRSNALWNLLPAAVDVNRSKGDKLPTTHLLRERQPVILDYWEGMRREYPSRFSREAKSLAGRESPDPSDLFGALLEAVEITALQRGCERWAPN